MLQKAVQAIVDLYRVAKTSSEQRADFADTVNKLRQQPLSQPVTASNVDGYEPKSQKKEVSLFDSLGATKPALTLERKAVGHWFKMSVPSARDKRMVKRERPYEADFRPGLGADDMNFQAFLSDTAKKKALESYVINYYNERPQGEQNACQQAPQAEEFPALNMPPLSETEELLLRLAQNDDETVRASVAGNENAPIAALWLLAEDNSTEVKLELIKNSASPIAILERLSGDFDGKVSRRALSKLRKMYENEVGIASGNLSNDGQGEEEVDDNSFDQFMAV